MIRDNPILLAWLFVVLFETSASGIRVCLRTIRGLQFRAEVLLPPFEPIAGVALLTLVAALYAHVDPPALPRLYFAAWIVMTHVVIRVVCGLVGRRRTQTIRQLEQRIAFLLSRRSGR